MATITPRALRLASLDDLTEAYHAASNVSEIFSIIASEFENAKLSRSITADDLANFRIAINHAATMARGIHVEVQLSLEPF